MIRPVRGLVYALACAFLCARVAHAGLEPKSHNALLFVESTQEGHEWEAYRLAEDRRPVVLDVDGPGRVLLTLRTFGADRGDDAVSVVLLDDRIVLTARVAPKLDESAKFPDEHAQVPSKVGFFLVRVPRGAHRVTVRYSGGPPTLVAARFSEDQTWDAEGEGDLPLVMPKAKRREQVPTVGRLLDDGELQAEPKDERAPPPTRWTAPIPNDAEDDLEPRTGPPRTPPKERGERAGRSASTGVARSLRVRAPWLLFEVRGGAQVNRLGLSVAPVVGMDARMPVPGLDARSFSMGLSAEVAHTQGDSDVLTSGRRAVVGVAHLRHTVFGAAVDLRWAFLREQLVDPYVAVGAGGLFGSMRSRVDEQSVEAASRGWFGQLSTGAALGGVGHRPYVEAQLQAGLLYSDLFAGGRSAYLAADLMIGFRFEFLTEVEVSAGP